MNVLVGLIASLSGELIDIKFTLVLALVQKVMGDLDGMVRVIYSFFMLVNLTQESTDLHVSFALIFEHLKTERRLFWVVEVRLKVFAL